MRRIKILIADNDSHYRDSLVGAVLSSDRYQLIAASNPQEARAVLARELVHMAIIDIRLENDENENDDSGLRICQEMDRSVARILLTGFKDGDQVRQALQYTRGKSAIANSVLFKLTDKSSDIRAEIERVLAEQFEVIPRDRIAVVTSGGDSPGMNAAIWGVVRTAMANEIEVMGIEDGYLGLTEGRLRKLTWNSTSEFLTRGCTMLGTARHEDFKKAEVRARAVENLIQRHISGLVVVGGDGSMQGAAELALDVAQAGRRLRTIAIPGTIDNDLFGTDLSLGTASAAHAITELLAQLVPPAQALRRIFVVEVMGRYCGFLALEAALASGADTVLIPETVVQLREDSTEPDWKARVSRIDTGNRLREELKEAADRIEQTFRAGKRYALVIVSEGISKLTAGEFGREAVAEYLRDHIRGWKFRSKPDVRVLELGYPSRGVAPGRFDMILGAELGATAVTCLMEGESGWMLGWSREMGVTKTKFESVVSQSNRPPSEIWHDRPRWRRLYDLHRALTCPPGHAEGLRLGGNAFVRSLAGEVDPDYKV